MDTQSRNRIINQLLGFRLPASYEIRTAVLSSSINPYIFRAGHQGVFFVDTFFSFLGLADQSTQTPFAGLPRIANEHKQALVANHDYGRFGQVVISVFSNFIPENTDEETRKYIKTFLTLQYFELVNGILKAEKKPQKTIH